MKKHGIISWDEGEAYVGVLREYPTPQDFALALVSDTYILLAPEFTVDAVAGQVTPCYIRGCVGSGCGYADGFHYHDTEAPGRGHMPAWKWQNG